MLSFLNLYINKNKKQYFIQVGPRELSCNPFDSVFVNNGRLVQYWVKSLGTIVRTISVNVPTNLQQLKGTLLLKWGDMAAGL